MVLFTNDTEQLQQLPSFADWLTDPGARHSFPSMPLVLFMNLASVVFGSTFAFACVASAALWLVYRAWRVLSAPLDELVGHLGFEIPQAPRLDLASIKADAVTLHWTPTDERKATTRYEVHVNGISAGQLQPTDNSFFIHNLAPDHVYIFRVVVYNASDLKATSEPVRVRTKPASTNDFYSTSTGTDSKDVTNAQSGPIIKTFKALPETIVTLASAPAMAREVSNGPLAMKRLTQMRRPSPVMHLPEAHSSGYEDAAFAASAEETQHQLNERLEEIAREVAETEKAIAEEEEEAVASKADLIKERDELRTSLKEKENNSKELRKHVSTLERENTTAQGRRTAHDRQLQARRAELRKVKADTQRWALEAEEMRAYVKDCEAETERMNEANAREKQMLQEKIDEEVLALKALEDEVKERNIQVKRLEREKTGSPASGEAQEYEAQLEQEAERDRELDEMLFEMDKAYKMACHDAELAKRTCQEAYVQLAAYQDRSRQIAYYSSNAPQQMPVSRHNSSRQHRGPSDQFSSPHLLPARLPAHESPFGPSLASNSTGDAFGPRLSPYFNPNNGMFMDADRDDLGMTSADVERLTGGAPMSPSAGAKLLPADLLSIADEDEASDVIGRGDNVDRSKSNEGMLPGLGAFGVLPGLGAIGAGIPSAPPPAPPKVDGPASPGSAGSRSPSLFASPKVSISNLAFHSPEPGQDSEARSIRSGRSIRPASGGQGQSGSRFAQILGLSNFNRQRGKTVDDELALGRIQSHSMPKDDPLAGLQSSVVRRRNSSLSGNFFGNLRTSFGNSKVTEDDQSDISKTGSLRRRPFMGIGSNGWGSGLNLEQQRNVSRPSSEHSVEQPRLSESGSTWSMRQTSDAFGSRNPSGGDWSQAPGSSVIGQHRNWGSRFPSRRQSGNFGSGSGMAYDIQEHDDAETASGPRTPALAPIGTKPTVLIERPLTPKLNPAAKDFRSLFSFKEGKKEKSDRKEKGRSRENTPSTPEMGGDSSMLFSHEDLSSPQSRKSKDSRSVLTAESSLNDLSSTHSLDQYPSGSHSDIPTSSSLTSSVGKGSFVRMLSRKSSGGKFSLPSFQREKKSKIPGAVNEESEEGSEIHPSPSADSLSKSAISEKDDKRSERASSRSWSAVFSGKMSKGKDKKDSKEHPVDAEKTPSISEASTTDYDDAALRSLNSREEKGIA